VEGVVEEEEVGGEEEVGSFFLSLSGFSYNCAYDEAGRRACGWTGVCGVDSVRR
jgi:hypothetical protein